MAIHLVKYSTDSLFSMLDVSKKNKGRKRILEMPSPKMNEDFFGDR